MLETQIYKINFGLNVLILAKLVRHVPHISNLKDCPKIKLN